MTLPEEALVFGLFSASSLPLGAVCGIVFSPVPQKVTAYFMAFGAGALIFAVATELFGDCLARLVFSSERHDQWVGCKIACQHHFWNLIIQTSTSLFGGLMYLLLNRCLTKESKHTTDASPSGAANSRTEELMQQFGAEPSRAGSTQSFSIDQSGVCAAGVTTTTQSIISVHERRFPDSFFPGSSNVALSMWLGLLLDGIPEALMLGFMTNEKAITFEFLLAVFVANFPEAFSAASLLRVQRVSVSRIFSMWMIVFVLTGLLAMLGSWIMPANPKLHSIASEIRSTGSAAAEGLTGGSMLAMVSTAMLPEACHGGGQLSGFFFVMGFATSVLISALGARFGDPHILIFS
eukprot:TRINITY_DN48574_c0_g1_i1.p1 TRINITY_DN48574_c0_g1~~TRINITY_DN48574_c0_g1_i1.p1  ORF type:complete len:349 (+),score=28.73 TRINITY_DN48574_c0_g1_i1:65-1111(+)